MRRKKKKKFSPLNLPLAVLVIALIAVLGVIAVNQLQYSAGEAYYDSLRGVAR